MKINKNITLVVFFCLSNVVCFSQTQKQNKKLANANAKYEEFSFVEARKLYKQLVNEGHKSNELYAHLGDTYFFNSNYQSALAWYSKLMKNGNNILPKYYWRYSMCLRSNQQYMEAQTVIKSYYQKNGTKDEAEKWNPALYLNDIKLQSGRYEGVGQVEINSKASDFGTALVPNEEAIRQAAEIKRFNKLKKGRIIRENAKRRREADINKLDKLSELVSEKSDDTIKKKQFKKLPEYMGVIYASAKDSTIFFKRRHSWDEKPYLKLYSAQITANGALENVKKLSGDINSKYHQSSPVITRDGKTMYFTRLVPFKKGKSKLSDKTKISHLKIFQAQKVDNKWVDIKELPYPINREGTSSAHPALSPDNDLLYFVSNSQKKIDSKDLFDIDTDLFVISRKKSGGFAIKVESLGDEVNTFGRETFPFVDNNGVVYFSSDGHPGLGGLDVFAAAKDNTGKYVIVNIGEPINSRSDDFAFVIDSDSKKGFFSSNRDSETGDDDLYRFLEAKPLIFPFKLSPEYFGYVIDNNTGKPINDALITIYNDLDQIVDAVTTDELGKYSLNLLPFKNYSFIVKKKGYQTEKVLVNELKISEKRELQIILFNELDVIVGNDLITLKEGDDLTDKLKLNPIYFDYGGYSLRKSTKVELDKIIDLLKHHPSISIEIRSHTDSRGRDDYNLKLSKNRAKTTVDYIKYQGEISGDRIWGDGYGETQLINKCKNWQTCTEAENKLNRRSEFIIRMNK